MAAANLIASERDKIDNFLRLPGLEFPKDTYVIDNKNTKLMIALGAIDIYPLRAGEQGFVVKRLALLFEIVLLFHKAHPTLDINSDKFYADALQSFDYDGMYNYLTPESLRHVIHLYTNAFVRSGLKVSEAGAVENGTVEKSPEVMTPIEPIRYCIKLEKMVQEWMIVSGIARRNDDTVEKPEAADTVFPQQKPDEPVDAYMPPNQHEFEELHWEQQEKHPAMSQVSDGRHERIDENDDVTQELEDPVSIMQASQSPTNSPQSQQPTSNDLAMDDLRRLKGSASRNAGHGVTLGPGSMFNSRSSRGRNTRLGPGGSLRRRLEGFIGVQKDPIAKQNETIDTQMVVVDMQKDTIERQQKIIDRLNGTIDGQMNTIDGQRSTIDKQIGLIERLIATVDLQNDTIARQVGIIEKANDDHYMHEWL